MTEFLKALENTTDEKSVTSAEFRAEDEFLRIAKEELGVKPANVREDKHLMSIRDKITEISDSKRNQIKQSSAKTQQNHR